MNKIARPLLVVVLGGIVLKGLVTSLEPRLVFFPNRGEDTTPAGLGLRYERVSLTTSDGEHLIAWQLEPDGPLADIVYFHGNGGNLSLWLPVLAALHRLQYRVLGVDYRGYGLSTGSPTEEGVYLDAEAAVRHAARARRPDRPLVFWGRSLGAAVAASATRHVVPDGLVLESGFPDKAAVIRGQPLLRALNVFGSYRFATSELLRDFRRPVLVMHGDRDTIVPIALGRELFEGLGAPKQFVAIRDADHNDFFDRSRPDYWDQVVRFIEGLRR
ncbi:MAG: alpha/beta hydrolase [Acidobacteria bacterium]|nr:alpha/beta hydrolase [Acidobacteriota bacterium]